MSPDELERLLDFIAHAANRIYLEREFEKWNRVGLGFVFLRGLPSLPR
jgi:hypothetical protein